MGPRLPTNFSLPRVSAFVQYAWDALPGLRLTSGFRYDAEFLPDEHVFVNRDWIAASGVGAEALESTLHRFSPRIGLRWNLRGRGNTVVVAGAGTHHGDLDPGALSEILSFGGGIDIRRGVGNLSGWPSLPDETAVPVTGERITLMNTKIESPRTRRAHFGLWQLLGEGTVLRVSGSFRRTEFLLRRTVPSPKSCHRPKCARRVRGDSILVFINVMRSPVTGTAVSSAAVWGTSVGGPACRMRPPFR